MKKSLLFPILISLVGVAVFGSFTMVHGADKMNVDCLVSIVEGAGCPALEGLLNSTISHLGVFKDLSLGILGFNFLNILASIWLVILAAVSFLLFPREQFLLSRESFDYPLRLKRHLSWLSLHENSPNL